jgi:hypothetical protein
VLRRLWRGDDVQPRVAAGPLLEHEERFAPIVQREPATWIRVRGGVNVDLGSFRRTGPRTRGPRLAARSAESTRSPSRSGRSARTGRSHPVGTIRRRSLSRSTVMGLVGPEPEADFR